MKEEHKKIVRIVVMTFFLILFLSNVYVAYKDYVQKIDLLLQKNGLINDKNIQSNIHEGEDIIHPATPDETVSYSIYKAAGYNLNEEDSKHLVPSVLKTSLIISYVVNNVKGTSENAESDAYEALYWLNDTEHPGRNFDSFIAEDCDRSEACCLVYYFISPEVKIKNTKSDLNSESLPKYAKESMTVLAANNLIVGDLNNNTNPRKLITLYELRIIIRKLCEDSETLLGTKNMFHIEHMQGNPMNSGMPDSLNIPTDMKTTPNGHTPSYINEVDLNSQENIIFTSAKNIKSFSDAVNEEIKDKEGFVSVLPLVP